MAINTISSSDSVNYLTSEKSEKTKGMSVDSDTFLQLLVAQLKYQDPLEPQTDTAFVTQLAQMTSLEQLQQMNETLSNSQAYDMIGKYVYAEVLNETTGVTECYLGLAESIVVKDGVQYVMVGGVAIPVSSVSQVIDASLFETETDETESAESELIDSMTDGSQSDTDSETEVI